jgi:hypothetical protein
MFKHVAKFTNDLREFNHNQRSNDYDASELLEHRKYRRGRRDQRGKMHKRAPEKEPESEESEYDQVYDCR